MDLAKNDHIPAARRPFNSSVEMGLRAVVLLNSLSPRSLDIQRLIYLDYLLLHSSDVPNGPRSLHPSIPHRSGEWIVKRRGLMLGLDLMLSRELITKLISPDGIMYQANELSGMFVDRLSTPYAARLKTAALWVSQTFADSSNESLSDFMRANVGKWGAEFGFESVLRGIPK